MKKLLILTALTLNVSAQDLVFEPTNFEEEKKGEVKTPSLFEKHSLGAYFGHAFVGSAYKVEGAETTFSGNSIRAGITKSVDQHKFRLGYEIMTGEIEAIQVEGVNYNADSLGISSSVEVKGVNLGYVYQITPHFAVGPYFKALSGDLTVCADNCDTTEVSVKDIGLRIEATAKYWNPYLEIGSSRLETEGKSHSGASVYIGILNLEF